MWTFLLILGVLIGFCLWVDHKTRGRAGTGGAGTGEHSSAHHRVSGVDTNGVG